MNCIFAFIQNPYIETLTPMWWCLEMGLWEVIRLDEVMRVGFYNEVSALIRKGREPTECTHTLSTMWAHNGNAVIFKPGRVPSLGNQSAGTLTSKTMRNEHVCFSHPVCSIFYNSPSWLRQMASVLLRGWARSGLGVLENFQNFLLFSRVHYVSALAGTQEIALILRDPLASKQSVSSLFL